MSTRRIQALDLWATAALTCTTVVTVVVVGRAFADWSYLRPMLLVVLTAHAVSLMLRAGRAPGWIAVPSATAVSAWVVAVAYYGDTAPRLLPRGATLDAFLYDVRTVLAEFPTAVAPVPSSGAFAATAAVAMAIVVVLSDTFAFRAGGQSEAVVPHGAMFVVIAAVGTPLWQLELSLAWVASVLVTIGLLRGRDRRRESLWLGGRPTPLVSLVTHVAAVAVAAAAIGTVVAVRLPGAGAAPLIDTRTGSSNVTEVVSPLVDIRSTIVDSSSTLLFTVESSDGPHYWRLLSLPSFDGTAWNPPAEDLEEFDGGGGDAGRSSSSESRQTIRISSLRGPMIPAAYRPSEVDADDDVYWAPDSESAIMPGRGLGEGDVIDIVSLVPELLPATLRAAPASPAPSPDYLEVPASLSSDVIDAAVTIAAAGATDFDRALALQQWFRTEFEYSTDVDFSNSARAIEAFLEARRGFCQQFAGTFAVMARLLGLPARVAVGFTPGERADDGTFRVFGRHAHAWPEVWFSGLGWVAFEPTPGRGSPDAASYLGVDPQQDSGPTNDTVPASTTTTSTASAATTTTTVEGRPSYATTTVASGDAGADPSASGGTWWLLVAVSAVLWAWRAPDVAAWAARRRRATSTPRSRVVRAWHRAARFAEWAGAGPSAGATPLEFAAAAGGRLSIGRRDLESLATLVGRVVYSDHSPTGAEVERCEELSGRIVAGCRPLLSRGRRAALRMAPWTGWAVPSRPSPRR